MHHPAPVSLDAIRAAIPARCFERRMTPSCLALARSIGLCLAVLVLSSSMHVVAYALAQGTALTGIWVVAHECGHHAFSEYARIDDAIGFVLHSALLVPYFSWQASHARHHAKIGHITQGETWVPPTRAEMHLVAPIARAIGNRAYGALYLLGTLLGGWPAYLLLNATGGRARRDGSLAPYWKPLGYDHFLPTSALFAPGLRLKVVASTAGCACTAYVVYATWPVSLAYYVAPLLVTNAWLVFYTLMHHTSPGVPHHGDGAWSWLSGAMGTVDRCYGVFDYVHHNIGSTHVVHHLFSHIPHYHAREATVHVKRALGSAYRHDARNVIQSAWEVATTCHFVDGIDGTQYFRSFGTK